MFALERRGWCLVLFRCLNKAWEASSSYAGHLSLLGLRLESHRRATGSVGTRFINGVFTNPQMRKVLWGFIDKGTKSLLETPPW